MVISTDTIEALRSFRVLVLGDFLLDTYTIGRVRRISPEAPVPVLEVKAQESRPGGAGNVVLNLGALGGHVICMGRVGSDVPGKELKTLLSQPHIDASYLTIQMGYPTPVKHRLIADSQQLLRFDIETIAPLDPLLEQEMVKTLVEVIPQVEIVALSDYAKGFLTPSLIQEVIAIAKVYEVPVIVDPKGTDFTKYRGATLLKPNLSEAYAAAQCPLSVPIGTVAQKLFSESPVDRLLITRSEEGMSLFYPEGKQDHFPVVCKEVKDVTGAGDTVLAILCAALANGLPLPVGVELSNLGAGIAIERLGCAQITLKDLIKRVAKKRKAESFPLGDLLKRKASATGRGAV